MYLDGRYAFGVKDIVAAGLRIGQHLTDDEIAELKEKDEFEKAYNSALNFLSYRPRSTAEVERNLRDKGMPAPLIEAVVDRLRRAGLLDDLNFAKYWVEQRERFKPRSAQMLRYELKQKGIAAHHIAEALKGLDEAASARRLVRQRAHRYAGAEREEFWRKMVSYLQRRGFHYQIIASVVEEVWQELKHGDADS